MAQNKMVDLRNHIFAQMERLNDESISPEAMALELEKSKAMAALAKPLVETAKIEAQLILKSESLKNSEFLGVNDSKLLG